MYQTREVVHDDTIYHVPVQWSDNAAKIFIAKYCRRYLSRFAETEVLQVFQRLANFWATDSDERYGIIRDLWTQTASPNSPQYFNAGIYSQYNVEGGNIGLWVGLVTPDDIIATPTDATYIHPQLHACFIQPVKDSLMEPGGIYDLLKKEARLFSRGSGTGTNFSTLRGKGEQVRGGGGSSGLLSFLEVFDKSAGAIKSGGTTRRAAKMVVLDIDHPDVIEFIDWKYNEERKARVLINQGGYTDSWEGDAYQTVSGQNSNNSVRIPDKFMDAVIADQEWLLIGRQDIGYNKFVQARSVWQRLCQRAWDCGDPGVQYSDTINSWNTTPRDGEIRASNPCSEHLRLDDSACNLASINLGAVLNKDGVIEVDRYITTIERWTEVLDRSIDLAGYPSEQLAINALRYRDIGLGYCNLGALLMRVGVPYNSRQGRVLAGLLTSILTGVAYRKSCQLAVTHGPYPAYNLNHQEHIEIMYRHRDALMKLRVADTDYKYLYDTARQVWKDAIKLAEVTGIRNAQLTVIAPTGTIGITMDCETTGVEPLYDRSVIKTLAGGGSIVQTADCVRFALAKLSLRNMTNVKKEDLPIFATAVDNEHGNSLSPAAHIDMVAAVQPHISGGISKTVNLPASATVKDISNVYQRAWRKGVKCVAVYRDGSKSQPLNPAECKTCGDGESCEL